MKPKIVIFSSSEQLTFARNFASGLRNDVECTVWRDLPFALSNYTQKDLVAFGKEFDFALLIFGYEDKAVIRGEKFSVTRDNVIYEFGLMSGLIGSDRCFIIECISNSSPNRHLPSDIKGITTVQFNKDCTDPKNELYDCVTTITDNINRLGQNKFVSEELISQLSVVGLSAFYTNRNDFRFRKSDDGRSLEQLKDYLSIAHKSIKLVVFTFAQGVVFGKVLQIFKEKLESFSDFTITVSLLNPYESSYYFSCRMTHDRDNKTDFLIREAKDSVVWLREFRNSLPPEFRERFNVKLHNTALFEPAVLIDDNDDNGRIQVEIHPYKVAVSERFAFEIKNSNDNPIFYNKLKNSYDQLLADATSLDEIEQ